MKASRLNPFLMAFVIINSFLFLLFLILRDFPPVFMILHLGSVLLLWSLVLWKIKLWTFMTERGREVLIVSGLIFISLLVGLYRVEEITPGMYPDEIAVATWGLKLMESSSMPPFVAEGYYHPTPLLYVTAWSIEQFGHTMTAVRLPSIVLGALAVGLFYILLRQFVPMPLALAGGLLLAFQYTHIVLSRLAYEPPASLFCQLLALIFLILYWKKKETIYLGGIALALGLGLYTYLNFRAFAVLVFGLTVLLILKKQTRKEVFLFAGLVFAAAAPLISYTLIDPQGFWGRAAEISIFARHYAPVEFWKELGGNIVNTLSFPFVGDPNPGKNPSNVSLFDPFTILFAAFGMIFLWRTKRLFFWLLVLFIAPPVVSDIFSTEVIPEFHYYGLGHPNALRVSGLIPVVLFAAIYGMYWLYSKWEKQRFAETMTVGCVVILGMCLLNWHWYFNQEGNHKVFFAYNYKYNHAKTIKTALHVNKTKAQSMLVNNTIADDSLVRFFLDPTKKLTSFTITSKENAISEITKYEVTAIGLDKDNLDVVNAVAPELIPMGFEMQPLNDPLGNPDVLIIYRRTSI